MWSGAAAIEDSMEAPQKRLSKELPYDPAIPLLGIYPKGVKTGSQNRYLYIHIHCSITCSRQGGYNLDIHSQKNG